MSNGYGGGSGMGGGFRQGFGMPQGYNGQGPAFGMAFPGMGVRTGGGDPFAGTTPSFGQPAYTPNGASQLMPMAEGGFNPVYRNPVQPVAPANSGQPAYTGPSANVLGNVYPENGYNPFYVNQAYQAAGDPNAQPPGSVYGKPPSGGGFMTNGMGVQGFNQGVNPWGAFTNSYPYSK